MEQNAIITVTASKLTKQIAREFSRDVIVEILGPIHSEIKEKDDKPEYKVLVGAHEAKVSPEIPGSKKRVVFNFIRKAVESIASILRKGTPVYFTHDGYGKDENRQQVGEVLKQVLREKEGVLCSVFIAYIYPEYRDQAADYDSCSMESVWEVIKNKGRDIVNKVKSISGLALLKSDEQPPAFDEAMELASIVANLSRAPDETTEEEPAPKPEIEKIEKQNGENSMSNPLLGIPKNKAIELINEFMKAGGIWPRDIIPPETVLHVDKSGKIDPEKSDIGFMKLVQRDIVGPQLKHLEEKVEKSAGFASQMFDRYFAHQTKEALVNKVKELGITEDVAAFIIEESLTQLPEMAKSFVKEQNIDTPVHEFFSDPAQGEIQTGALINKYVDQSKTEYERLGKYYKKAETEEKPEEKPGAGAGPTTDKISYDAANDPGIPAIPGVSGGK